MAEEPTKGRLWVFAVATLAFVLAIAGIVMPFSDEGHREWGWADEQGWIKTFAIPYIPQEQTGAEVITKGDYVYIGHPSHLYINGTTYIYYSAYRSIVVPLDIDVCVRSSTDFTSFGSETTLITKSGTGWRKDAVAFPRIIYDPYETDDNKKYKMFIQGYRKLNGSYESKLGLFYSSSPTGTFTEDANNPITFPNFDDAGVTFLRLGNLYYAAYRNSVYQIVVSTSPDLITWTYYGVILDKGATWDDTVLTHISIVWISGVWYLLYSGRGTYYKIGIAMDTTGFGTFSKFTRNPVIKSTSATKHVMSPTLFQYERGFKLYYGDENTNGIYLYDIP